MCPDHVHMQLEIPLRVSVSSFMGYLKGKNRRIYSASAGRRQGRGTTDDGKFLKPVYGQQAAELSRLADRTCAT